MERVNEQSSRPPPGSFQECAGERESQIACLRGHMLHWIERGGLEVPSIPSALAEAMRLANNPYSSMREIEKLIEMDQAVAVRLLRYANSSYFKGISKIHSIRDAIVRIGQHTLRNLLFGLFLETKVFRSKSYQNLVNALWMHGIGCAVLSRYMAPVFDLDPEAAFLAGLLHDAGKTALIGSVVSSSDIRPLPSPEVVEIAMDDLHTMAGLEVVERWQLPETIVEAVSSHHNFQGALHNRRMVALIQAADILSYKINLDCLEAPSEETPEEDLPLARTRKLRSSIEINSHPAFQFLGIEEEIVEKLEEEKASLQDKMSNPFLQKAPTRSALVDYGPPDRPTKKSNDDTTKMPTVWLQESIPWIVFFTLITLSMAIWIFMFQSS